MKETGEYKDRTEGWIEMCDRLNFSLEETESLLAKIIGPVVQEVDEKVPGDVPADALKLERRLSKATQLAHDICSRMGALADRF